MRPDRNSNVRSSAPEAKDALVGAGCKPAVARAAVDAVLADAPDIPPSNC